MNDSHDTPTDPARGREGAPATAGGGAHDITGAEAAEHVAPPLHGEHAAAHGDAEEQPLGSIDWAAWRAAVLGVAIAALICFLFYLAIAA
jgi:hypothetical protein